VEAVRAKLFQTFRERRGSFSTRVSQRGHGHEFTEDEDFHGDLARQIRQHIATLRRVYPLWKASAGQARSGDLWAQVTSLRGELGNLRKQMSVRATLPLERYFMTACSHLLPNELFYAIKEEARWLRDRAATDLGAEIDRAMADTPTRHGPTVGPGVGPED
jgi:hypothetical protein